MEIDRPKVTEKTMSKTYQSWSKRTETNGNSKELRVDQVENGFVISLSTETETEKDGWKYETRKYISTKNPFVDEPEDIDESFITGLNLDILN